MMAFRMKMRPALLASAFFLSATAAFAAPSGTMFPSASTSLYGNADSASSIGTVTPGTSLTIEKTDKSSSRAEVELDGWSQKGGEGVIFQQPGVRIIIARLDQPGKLSTRTVTDKKTDSYGTTWEHVKLMAWVAESALVPHVSQVWEAGKQIYTAHCSTCHALHDPGEFTANQWPGELRAMAPRAGLTAAQLALVTRYLQANARNQ